MYELDRIIGVGPASDPQRTVPTALAPCKVLWSETSQGIDKLSSLQDRIFEALFETSQYPVLLHQAAPFPLA